MGPYYKYMDCPEDFLKFENIVGDYYVCSDDYLDEVWAIIPGHPDYYISNYGRAYSAKTDTFLKPKRLDRKGHIGFGFSEGKNHKDYQYLHRLMAEAFIWNPDNLPVVRHLNDDPMDNDLDNLAWGTQQDNWYDSLRNGTARMLTDEDREKGFEKVRIPVKAVNLRTGDEMIFRGQSEAARELGLQQANVWKVLNGQRPATGGYYFEYLEKDGDTNARYY